MVLQPERADIWLAGDNSLIDTASEDTPALKAFPVDRRVNNARNEGEELIEAIGPEFR